MGHLSRRLVYVFLTIFIICVTMSYAILFVFNINVNKEVFRNYQNKTQQNINIIDNELNKLFDEASILEGRLELENKLSLQSLEEHSRLKTKFANHEYHLRMMGRKSWKGTA